MRAHDRRVGLVAGILGLAASLVFSMSEPVSAGLWSNLLRNDRTAGTTAQGKAAKSEIAAEKSANCGKCHSSCEYGRTHLGLAPTKKTAGNMLPFDSRGLTNCLTCHKDHAKGVEVAGNSLRMPNLRRELCLACHQQETAQEPRVEIVSPLERAAVLETRVALIGRAANLAGAQLTVRLNDAEFHLHVKDGEIFTWLRLQDGVNHIALAQQGRVLWSGEIFHGASASANNERASSGHLTETREQCGGCHKKSGEATAAVAQAPGLCFGCHERNDSKRYVHGPLAVGACLTCHDPHSGYGSAHLRKEQRLLCGDCHTAREATAAVSCRKTGGMCVDCHDPHQSDMKYLLKQPQYTMREVQAPRP